MMGHKVLLPVDGDVVNGKIFPGGIIKRRFYQFQREKLPGPMRRRIVFRFYRLCSHVATPEAAISAPTF